MSGAPDRLPGEWARRLAEFPANLRTLVEAELAAGNEIVEIAHGFPAAPCGAYLMLARAVSTRPREDGGGLSFYDRNGSSYSGEWHDARRHWFVLEPPHPPEPLPDVDEVRARLSAAARGPAPSPEAERGERRRTPGGEPAPGSGRATADAVGRFRESMNIDYEKWHDGIGYDLDLLRAATPAERAAIEGLLVARGASGWRDVEALAALETPAARAELSAALESGNHEVRLAVLRHAPDLVPDEARVAALVAALEGAEIMSGLSEALDEAAEFHPPPVLDALFRGALARDGGTAVHFAAMLTFLHGRADEPFDWNQRPFFLRFHTEDRGEREAVFREMCAKIGVDAAAYLGT